jgi:hypothetical protein
MASKLPMKRVDSKFEARNPKFETYRKGPNSKAFPWFAVFEPLEFEFVSDFGFFDTSKLLGSGYTGLGR